MAQSTKVTIITPTYNREKYIEEVIQSILSQEYPNLEYIVLDDGSKDNTTQILKKYEGKIIWESHKNMGETRTVNKGFEMATGDIIAVINSDDPLLPGSIKKMIEYLMQNPSIDIVYPDWDMIDENGKPIPLKRAPEYIAEYSYINMVKYHSCLPGPGTFFRKKVLEFIHGRDSSLKYVADFDFWLRAGLHVNFARYPEVLATFRVHSGSASVSTTGAIMAKEHIALMKKYYSNKELQKDILGIKRDAFSSAYYVAGVVCGNNNELLMIRYHMYGFLHKPTMYLCEKNGRIHTFLGVASKNVRKSLISLINYYINRGDMPD